MAQTAFFESFEPETPQLFVEVVLPLALPKTYTYYVPNDLADQIKFGIRVEVQLKERTRYAAIVVKITNEKPTYSIKPILNIIDDKAIVTEKQIQFWQWIAEYYACTLGEVMIAALPTNLKLVSETKIILSLNIDNTKDFEDLDPEEYLVAEALTLQRELMISEVQKILNTKTKKSAYSVVNRLLEKEILALQEELTEKYKPKMVSCIAWAFEEGVTEGGDFQRFLHKAFDAIAKSEKQTSILLALIELLREGRIFARASDIYERVKGTSLTDLKALEKKKIIYVFEREVSRLQSKALETFDKQALTQQQKNALIEIHRAFQQKNVVFLQGVTGSGKTRVYIELIAEALARGEQVLYLLPEIALTTQIIQRLQQVFGNDIAVYHSRVGGQQRVELWRGALAGKPILLGARSSLLLPFRKLGLIIVDEEHDPSFKQQDPAPRYQARDSAIYLANLLKCKILLGSATPSVETYYNAKMQKYGLVKMTERFGGLEMPNIELVDLRKEVKNKTLSGNFSARLLTEMQQTLERKQQIILFQNRRGFAPTLTCPTCGWISECKNCDVTLTYHKFSNSLDCHYCGFHQQLPKKCPACGSNALNVKGFGTERIEDELQVYMPELNVARLDLDTARSRHAHAKIINDFEERRVDVLIGTQMVAKGLDFDNVGLVGVLSADALLRFPNFRASERAFQLLMQVSGRAGRKNHVGKVLIQTYDIEHAVLKDVMNYDEKQYLERELIERQQFSYPPFVRLVVVSLRHTKPDVLLRGTEIFNQELRVRLGARVHGPAKPTVQRVNTYYIWEFLIKLERDARLLHAAKQAIYEVTDIMQHQAGFSTIKVMIDVDP
jgi:primosomal protein N' (replication factor Y)